MKRTGRKGKEIEIKGKRQTEGERVGNKREVGWDTFILQRGRYVGIASRGSLSRTANYGIMHTVGPRPAIMTLLWIRPDARISLRAWNALHQTMSAHVSYYGRTFISLKTLVGENWLKRTPRVSCPLAGYYLRRNWFPGDGCSRWRIPGIFQLIVRPADSCNASTFTGFRLIQSDIVSFSSNQFSMSHCVC